jgi:hypothetical protein
VIDPPNESKKEKEFLLSLLISIKGNFFRINIDLSEKGLNCSIVLSLRGHKELYVGRELVK